MKYPKTIDIKLIFCILILAIFIILGCVLFFENAQDTWEAERIAQFAKRGTCVLCKESKRHKEMDTNIMMCDDCFSTLEDRGLSIDEIKKLAREAIR